jgi:polar amino acid transport system permease protein
MDWDFTVVWRNLPAFGRALTLTLWITAASILIGTVLGILLGVGSLMRPRWIRWPARFAVELLLALPVLVIIIWMYYALPLVNPVLTISGLLAAILGLGVSLAGFVAEIVRAGINAVPSGQLEVAYCTGMTRAQTLMHILLPQALRRMWPPLVGQYITCYKMSTLASVIAVQELLHTGSNIIAQTYRPMETYTAIAAIFLLTLWPMNYLARRVEQTARLGGTLGL